MHRSSGRPIRLTGQDSLAARASKRLKGDELLVTGFAATLLRMELDRVPLWRGNDVAIKQIVEDFARYLYLPRVADPTVLLKAMSDGVGLLTWEHDAFALADSFDDEAKRYRGLRGGQVVSLTDADAHAVCSSSRMSARRQLDAEKPQPGGGGAGDHPGPGGDDPILRRRTGTWSATTGHAGGDPAYTIPWNRTSRLRRA